MKTVWYILLMFVALALSCKREDTLDNIYSALSETHTIHYTVSATSATSVKATLNGDTQYVFEAGDRLFVCHNEGGVDKLYGALMLISGVGERTARFEGDLVCVKESDGQFFKPTSTTSLSVTLVSSSDAIHEASEGKVSPATYPAGACASNLEAAVQYYSDFTCTTTYGATQFTLNQNTSFVVCKIKMPSANLPAATAVSASLISGGNAVWEGTVSSTVNGAAAKLDFVIPLEGGSVTLSSASLTLEWTDAHDDPQSQDFALTSSATLAANTYYTIDKSSLRFDGFRIRTSEASTKITFNYSGNGLEYTLDEGETWLPYDAVSEIVLANAGDEICFQGNKTSYNNSNTSTPLFTANKLCYISGDITSLLDGGTLTANAFNHAFSKGSTAVTYIDIDPLHSLILPSTTAESCYEGMFMKCTSLTKVPELPADALFQSCYKEMFSGCTNITSLPSGFLPATSLAASCYEGMFSGCTSLTNAPILPAIILAESCYAEMFKGCTLLGSSPALPATALAASCYQAMFKGCSNLETASPIDATTLEDKSCKQMFMSCTMLSTAPTMTINTLNGTENCSEMFGGVLTVDDTKFTYSVTNGCANLQNISNIHLNATELTSACYYAMFMGSAVTSVPDDFLPAEDLAVACYMQMFLSCEQLTHVPPDLLPASTLMKGCYANMFRGCSSLVDPPDLEATDPVPGCYFGMFRQCTSLTHIKCLIVLATNQQGKTRPGAITDTGFPMPSVVEDWMQINVWTVFNKWLDKAKDENTGELIYNSAMPTPEAVYTKGQDVGKVPAKWKRTPYPPVTP